MIAGVAGWCFVVAVAAITSLVDRVEVARAAIADFGAVALPVIGAPALVRTQDRHTTIVRESGEPVVAIVHDGDVPFEAVDLAARLTGAQLAARRATALARSRGDAVRTATGNLVRAGDRASVAVAAQLADGPLPALADLAARLRAGTCPFGEALTILRGLTAEVRGLSHGLFPRDLEEQGLAPILATRGAPSRRLGAAVELTCYLLVHDDGGATISDDGRRLVVSRSAAPDADLIERVEALGGRVDGTVSVIPTEP